MQYAVPQFVIFIHLLWAFMLFSSIPLAVKTNVIRLRLAQSVRCGNVWKKIKIKRSPTLACCILQRRQRQRKLCRRVAKRTKLRRKTRGKVYWRTLSVAFLQQVENIFILCSPHNSFRSSGSSSKRRRKTFAPPLLPSSHNYFLFVPSPIATNLNT